jgi:hypothetical protein
MQTRQIDLSTPKKSNAYLRAMNDLQVIQSRKQNGAVTLSGDAWESAACYVIDQKTGNAESWKHIAQFLEDQELEALGLRRLSAVCASRQGPACGMGPRSAHPVGNTGITSTIANGVSNG